MTRIRTSGDQQNKGRLMARDFIGTRTNTTRCMFTHGSV